MAKISGASPHSATACKKGIEVTILVVGNEEETVTHAE
jgi:hypothetical protein